ncbi:MAG TPA: ATP-binding cassette domain-containing protein [Clostridiales bacterium]|nr:ATP-binding cassette domain-containing protein [Clostridiales bacterium]
MSIINAYNLSKSYRIHEKQEGVKNTIKDFFNRKYTYKDAVINLNMTIEKGEIIGLLGENGAGKTTTLKMLSGILYPTYGKVIVLNYTPTQRKKEFLKKIAFVMGNKSEINWDLPAVDTFRYQKLVYQVPNELYNKNINLLAEMLNVKHLLNIQLRRLSLGERMKMELINSFLYSPEIVFLDEPTIGLDLNSQIAIRKFLRQYREERKTTIIITSHYMDDIEETCDRVILLSKGRKIFDGSISEVSRLYSTNKVLQLVFDKAVNPLEFAKYGEIIEFKDNTLKLIIRKEQYKSIVTELIGQNRNITDISITNVPFKNIVNQIMAEGRIS